MKSTLSEILRELDNIVERYYEQQDIDMYYGDYRRRVELLNEILNRVPSGAKILDAGCAPGFTSLALSLLGFNVICLDINPEPYQELLEKHGITVIKADLERDRIPLPENTVDAVVFTEVLEHLNPYYVSWTLSELNRVLKLRGLLFLTTPNIASIGKRVKLLLGKSPLGPAHVREYTMGEVVNLLNLHGFKCISTKFSMAYDLTPYNARGRDYLLSLAKAVIKYPSKENLFKLLVLPIVKVIPQLRATIFVIAEKVSNTEPRITTRRF